MIQTAFVTASTSTFNKNCRPDLETMSSPVKKTSQNMSSRAARFWRYKTARRDEPVPPVNSRLLSLPAELLIAIMENLSESKDIAALRRTCRKIGRFTDSQANLYRLVTVSQHPWARTRLELVALNRIPNITGELVKTSSRVKTLVFEDIRIVAPNTDYRDLSDLWTRHQNRLYNMAVADSIGVAAQNFSRLETIEYDPGSSRTMWSRDTLDMHFRAIAREIAHTSDVASRQQEEMFCKVVELVLRNRCVEAKPLTVEIRTPVTNFFNETIWDHARQIPRTQYPNWPSNNRLENLDIRYTGNNAYCERCFKSDLGVLCGRLGRHQFANLRSLTLGGNKLLGREFLCLDSLGSIEFIPDWTNLRKLRLENVSLSYKTVRLLRAQRFDLEIHNAMCHHSFFLSLPDNSTLRSVQISGILVCQRWRYPLHRHAKRLTTSQHPVWLIAKRLSDVQAIIRECHHQPHLKLEVPWVSQAKVEKYMLEGGFSPMSQANMWSDKLPMY
ncbi:hypothetical protein C7974DRAFT_439826 [Boeremia exigua]|uniref:uncharacterized protein n=1 Tax=Boeremia exigua TaxID=749465 RepID=UPI001E8E5CF4|nr:uncharacterized protein C7974DRAFT_439826 [Boeremia exigua]KAH6644470.1 hypothetical protein C7974DRAFT_439826 [Boeremia exigua]